MQNELTNIAHCDNIAMSNKKVVMILRKWLIELREQKNITQAVMAKKLNISQSYYAQIEAGERQADLNLSTLTALSEIFKISISKIIKYERALNNADD